MNALPEDDALAEAARFAAGMNDDSAEGPGIGKIPEMPEHVREGPDPLEPPRRVLPEAVTREDFHAYMPAHSYIYTPTREPWPASSVNSRIPPIDIGLVDKSGEKKPIPASAWLDRFRPVEQMTWCPGLPMVIENKLVADGGWIDRPGCSTFNLYRPAPKLEGDANKAERWLDHIAKVYPESYGHIILWMAHRVQRPGEKINHALFLGGVPGIGKDTIIEPVKVAVGEWNVKEVSPKQLLGRFNPFLKSVILRVSEARDMGDVDRYALYESLKTLEAAPPNVLTCDEKNLREHAVFNVCGVIITSNHKTDGIYLPADDRRHYVSWSDLTPADFPDGYWRGLHRWYETGGNGHVAAYLASVDLSSFDAKAPPPKTAAFWAIVDANRAPEDAELADALEMLREVVGKRGGDWDGSLPAVTISMITAYATDSFREWLKDRRNSKSTSFRMEAAGYAPVRNGADTTDGRWRVDGKRQVIYAKCALSVRDRFAAAETLVKAFKEGRT